MVNEDKAQKVIPIVEFLKKYHRHKVLGLGRFPKEGPVIVLFNHSLATYDIALLGMDIYKKYGKIPRSLIDTLFYKVPYVGELMEILGSVKGTRANAEKLLKDEEVIFIAPGGMRESLRPSSERYQFLWNKRKGFIKLAIKMKTPIVLSACPKADDIYEVYPNKVTSWFYKKFKVPIFLARGVGPTPLPKPVQLIHHLSTPILPPDISEDDEGFDEAVEKFHKKIVDRMTKLMSKAVMYREDKAKKDK
jgi:1-acyl-sn-glycerol-3-phosphate acyltransferase